MILGALIALKIVLLFAFAWNTRLVMDEFAQLGWAKYLFNGLYETIWHAKSAGGAVFFKFAHLIGWDATSILLIGRMQTALLGCAILAIVYACARALGEDRLRALFVILVLLCFSNFIERVFRTIAEPLALFFAAAALLVILRGRADRSRDLVIAGILSGLAFLTTQKSVYFNLALGLAVVADAALARRYAAGIARGLWLVAGWAAAFVAYCFIFGGANPLPIAQNLVFGPVEVATTGADAYGGLRHYVGQTLMRNAVPYLFCFAGMGLAMSRLARLDERRRIALVFTTVITLLVFAHDQPWPYVFIMAQPFMALWALGPLDLAASEKRYLRLAWLALGIGIATSLVRNIVYLGHDNRSQLELVERAESLLRPDEVYFDAVGMLPNRAEPSILWLDRIHVLKTLKEKERSEAYRIFASSPPKLIIWNYRLDAVEPVIGPLIRDSYVRIAPNLRIAGRRLSRGEPVRFDVPVAGAYRLYSLTGMPAEGGLEIDGSITARSVRLTPGSKTVTLRSGPAAALLLPEGSYRGQVVPGGDNPELFAGLYN